MSNPWDRQPKETEKAYAAFCVYRDQGVERSLDATWRQQSGKAVSGRAPGKYSKWSAQWGWVRRARAWDDHERERQAKEAEAIRDAEQQAIIDGRVAAKKARIELGEAMLQKAIDAIEAIDIEKISPRDAINLARIAQEQLRKDYETEQSDEEQKDVLRDIVDERLKELANAPAKDLADTYRDILAATRQGAAQKA